MFSNLATRDHSPCLPRAGGAEIVKPCSSPSGFFTYHSVIADCGLQIADFAIAMWSPLAVISPAVAAVNYSP